MRGGEVGCMKLATVSVMRPSDRICRMKLSMSS